MKRYEGITLIALIITVIVMLIIAGVALSTINGENGLFGRTQKTAELYNNQAKNEESEFNKLKNALNGDYSNGNEEETIPPTEENITIEPHVHTLSCYKIEGGCGWGGRVAETYLGICPQCRN